MATVQAELRRLGIELTPQQFELMVLDALREMPDRQVSRHPSHELTADEWEALQRGAEGLDLASEPTYDPIARTAAKYAAILATSLSVSQVAEMLGVDPSRVRQRLLNRTLYGLKVRNEWRMPAFQFDVGKLLPGLDRVVPHLDPSLHPVGVVNWFTLPDPDLEIDDQAVSPRDWLRSGGDPDLVAQIAADL